jgi:hypothetical protein
MANIPIVKAATAYDSPTGETLIIVLAQSLYLGDHIEYSLLCPNQLRHNGIVVDDIPRHLAPVPELATHSIYVPEDDVRIPLTLRGVISLFHTRYPTVDEIENCRWLLFTSELEWDPHSITFEENENAVSDHASSETSSNERSINNIISNLDHSEVINQLTRVPWMIMHF